MASDSSVSLPPITSHQQFLLEEIRSQLEMLSEFEGQAIEDMGPAKQKEYLLCRRALDEFTARALRHFIKKTYDDFWHLHPGVPEDLRNFLVEWILTHRALGNRRLLRPTKSGIEKRVKRVLREKYVEIVMEIIRLQKKPDMDTTNGELLGTLTEMLEKHRITFDPETYQQPHQLRKLSLRSVFLIMLHQGKIPKMSYRNFHKWVRVNAPYLLSE
jgi:hypothetical protein